MTDREGMQLAIDKAAEGVRNGQTPFGACIVRDGAVLACSHNVVWATADITAHAEITALREACRAAGSIDLSGAVIYSTCEPCPMCFSACHWARIRRVVFGAGIADARAAGFNELALSNDQIRSISGSPVAVEGGFMRAECVRLFDQWLARSGRPY